MSCSAVGSFETVTIFGAGDLDASCPTDTDGLELAVGVQLDVAEGFEDFTRGDSRC